MSDDLSKKTDLCPTCDRGWTWVDGNVHKKSIARVAESEAENDRMRDCLLVMSNAVDVGAGSLKTAAYDVVLNCITADVLKTRFAR